MRGELTHEQCDEVKKRVVEMFEECEIHSYPIDPFDIASKLHYILVPYSSLSAEGLMKAIAVSDDAFSQLEFLEVIGMYRYVVYYNDRSSPGRIRWTLSHEIGHCYLGHHEHLDDGMAKTEEAEANLFAKYTLAPPPLIHELQLASPADVARIFDMTDDAAYYSFSYYRKWLRFGPREYTDFEIQLLHMFHMAA